MKAKGKNIELEELFRHKLENSEVMPGVSIGKKLMRKLAFREFIRFNIGQFNIYYLGLVTAALTTAAVVFTFNTNELEEEKVVNTINEQEIETNVEGANDDYVTEAINVEKQSMDNNESGTENNKAKPLKEKNKNRSNTPTSVSRLLPVNEVSVKKQEDNTKLSLFRGTGDKIFEPSVTEGCAPLKVLFRLNTSINDSCYWNFGDMGTSMAKEPEWIFDSEGEYIVTLKLLNAGNREITYSTVINVHPKPKASFEAIQEQSMIKDNEIVFYNYSVNAARYKWNFGDENISELFEPRHQYPRSGRYNVILTAYSDYGCIDTTMLNLVAGSLYSIDFPNAFIPNVHGPTGGYFSPSNDEKAQVFHPVAEGVDSYHLKVFSKLGVFIFESTDINIGWDGYFNGQMCEPGVYVWKVQGSFIDGENYSKMGDVTLLRTE